MVQQARGGVVKLIISGAPRGAGVNQLLLRKASNYFTDLLMREDVGCLKSIKVELKLVANLQTDYNASAFCSWLDKPINPLDFLVELDSDLKIKTSLIALAHELVHVKQMAFGEKQQSLDGTKMRWMGQIIDHIGLHYYDQPWEIEALGREYGLYDRFIAIEQGHSANDVEPAIVDDHRILLRLISQK